MAKEEAKKTVETTASTAPVKKDTDWKEVSAIVSLVLGILNLCSWFIPLCGCPMAIIGIVLGVLGIQSDKKTMAIIGLVLSSLSLIGTIINAIIGAAMAPDYSSFEEFSF